MEATSFLLESLENRNLHVKRYSEQQEIASYINRFYLINENRQEQ
jgi:hypothetical protein